MFGKFVVFLFMLPSLFATQDQEPNPYIFADIVRQAMPISMYIEISAEDNDYNRSLCEYLFSSPNQISFQGSGFFITSNGYILTCYHLIENATDITVYLYDDREYDAQIIGFNRDSDIAILKIDEKNLPTLEFGNSDKINIGNPVIAIGSPTGLEFSVSRGIISGIGRQDMGLNSREEFLQVDTIIIPGFSGGPLINHRQKILGMNAGYTGPFGLTIPSNLILSEIKTILEDADLQDIYDIVPKDKSLI